MARTQVKTVWLVMEIMQVGSLPRSTIHAIYSNAWAAGLHVARAEKLQPLIHLEVHEWEVHGEALSGL